MRYFVIIPAAGQGRRFASEHPKQYHLLGGKPVLAHVVDFFISFPFIEKMIIALHEKDTIWPKLAVAKNPRVATVIGGEERCHSVFRALEALMTHTSSQDWILVHDAVRPCLSKADFLKLIDTVHDHPVGGVLGFPIRDTLKQVDGEKEIIQTISRSALWQAQTPQIFRCGILYEALKTAITKKTPITDEAMAVECMGLHPKMVEGSATNLKITWPEDLILAHAILEKYSCV